MPISSLAIYVAEGAAEPAPPTFAEELVRYQKPLAQLARALAHDKAAADDLLQDTLERALRAAHRFKLGSNLAGWLRRIMRNLFNDRCRQGARVRTLGPEPADGLPADDPRTVTCLDLIDMADVHAALDQLESLYREIFVLGCVQRLSYRTISKQLGIPMSTVGSRIFRARARLRRALESQWQRSVPLRAAPLDTPGARVSSANDVGATDDEHSGDISLSVVLGWPQ